MVMSLWPFFGPPCRNCQNNDVRTHIRGVVVWERSGTPFRQIFWSRNGAPATVVGHTWNANTEAFQQITSYSLGWPSISLFSGPNCPQTRDLASKISKKIPGVTPPDSLSRRGRPPPTLAPVRGRKLRRCCYLGLGNSSPKSKFTTGPVTHMLCYIMSAFN